jgi:hypothetical protein
MVTEAFKEGLEREAESKVVDMREDCVADNFDNPLPVGLQLLLQHLRKGLELPQRVCIPNLPGQGWGGVVTSPALETSSP